MRPKQGELIEMLRMLLSAKVRKESASVEYLIISRGSVTSLDLLRTSLHIPNPTEALLL